MESTRQFKFWLLSHALEALQTIPHTGSTLVLEFLGVQNSTGENECFGINQIELAVHPPRLADQRCTNRTFEKHPPLLTERTA